MKYDQLYSSKEDDSLSISCALEHSFETIQTNE